MTLKRLDAINVNRLPDTSTKRPKISNSVLVSGIIGITVAAAIGFIALDTVYKPQAQSKKETATECQKDSTANFVVIEGGTFKTGFFGVQMEMKVKKIGSSQVELFGAVPETETISDLNETIIIPFGGKMILQTADPSGKHNEWSISAEKGFITGTAFITLSN